MGLNPGPAFSPHTLHLVQCHPLELICLPLHASANQIIIRGRNGMYWHQTCLTVGPWSYDSLVEHVQEILGEPSIWIPVWSFNDSISHSLTFCVMTNPWNCWQFTYVTRSCHGKETGILIWSLRASQTVLLDRDIIRRASDKNSGSRQFHYFIISPILLHIHHSGHCRGQAKTTMHWKTIHLMTRVMDTGPVQCISYTFWLSHY